MGVPVYTCHAPQHSSEAQSHSLNLSDVLEGKTYTTGSYMTQETFKIDIKCRFYTN
jgi:hypothetical protein